jgi:RND family efflux transporter MFP subunit
VPIVLVLGFLAVLAWSLGGALERAVPVRIVRPTPVTGGRAAQAGEVVARAAGWVEPDPFPVRVTALAPGVVREVLVQESDEVEAGQPVARLVDEDARLAVRAAEAALATARAERRRALGERDAARETLELAIEPTARARSAAALLEGARAEAELRAQAVVKGRAALRVAEDELVVQRELEAAGAAGPRQVELAEARVDEARGALAMLEAEAARAAAGSRAAEAEEEGARRALEQRIEDRLRMERAAAELERAEAAVSAAETALDEARLWLERTTVRAPVAGLVLERLATIGSALSGDAAVATLYDPRSIRVRVDVPQQDLGALFVGQTARIESDARPGEPYRGEVQRVVRRADIQKVTLQAHVRVLDGDELLRPEMLVQVRFLAPEPGEGDAAPAAALDLVAIPSRLVVDGARVWIVDGESGRATLREVRLGAERGDQVLVEAGLDLSDELIDADPALLSEGARLEREEWR